MTDIRILSCPQCGFPKIRDCGNGLYQCDDCGTYFDKNENIVQTNEEWFCGLSTEEKAEFSMRVFRNCTWCLDGGNPQECPFNAFLDCPAESKENMVKWLRGEHK